MLEIFYVLITLNLEKIIPFYNTYLLNLKSFCYLCVCFWLKSLWFVAVHGVWEEWSPWSLCSFTCGRGQRTRTRSCIPPQYGGRSCDGPETQHKPCNIALCPGELIKQLYALLWCIQCELFVISFIILCAHTQIKKKKKKKTYKGVEGVILLVILTIVVQRITTDHTQLCLILVNKVYSSTFFFEKF